MNNIQEKKIQCVNAFTLWFAHEDGKVKNKNKADYDAYLNSFIPRVLLNKLKSYDIDINIPVYLILIIELCVGSNPGMAQMMLADILSSIKDLKSGYTIKTLDFSMLYKDNFPIIDYDNPEDEFYKRFLDMWDNQKYYDEDHSSLNKCDTKEYWMSFLKES